MRINLSKFLADPICKHTSIRQLSILLSLVEKPKNQAEIASELKLKPNVVSRAVEKLFEGGLVLTTEVPDDRRSKRIMISEKAKDYLNGI